MDESLPEVEEPITLVLVESTLEEPVSVTNEANVAELESDEPDATPGVVLNVSPLLDAAGGSAVVTSADVVLDEGDELKT